MRPITFLSILMSFAFLCFSCNNDDELLEEYRFKLNVKIVSSGENITNDFDLDSIRFSPFGCIYPISSATPLEHLDTVLLYGLNVPCCDSSWDERELICYNGISNPIDTFYLLMDYPDSTMTSYNCEITSIYSNSNTEIEIIDDTIYFTLFE